MSKIIIKGVLLFIGLAILLFIGRLHSEGKRSQTMAPLSWDNLQCPPSPNCVSSLAQGEHFIEPLDLGPATTSKLKQALKNLGIIIKKENNSHIHGEHTSKIFGFVDDIHISSQPNSTGKYDIRSASRVGYSDLNANRNRIEKIKAELKK